MTQRKKHRDPYAIAQAKARKSANLSKQEILKKERASTLGDPVRGTETDFVRSFDTALASDPTPTSNATTLRTKKSPGADAPGPSASRDEHLNFFLSKAELDQGIEHSSWLLTPTEEDLKKPTTHSMIGELSEEERRAKIGEEQTTASEAMRRIASLSLASSKDRLRVNTQRCIDSFGRHNTDKVLDPKPAGVHPGPRDGEEGARRPRHRQLGSAGGDLDGQDQNTGGLLRDERTHRQSQQEELEVARAQEAKTLGLLEEEGEGWSQVAKPD